MARSFQKFSIWPDTSHKGQLCCTTDLSRTKTIHITKLYQWVSVTKLFSEINLLFFDTILLFYKTQTLPELLNFKTELIKKNHI